MAIYPPQFDGGYYVKKILAFIIIVNANHFTALNASQIYGIATEDKIFERLRNCYFNELKSIKIGEIQQVRDNLSLFYTICTECYPGKVTLELIRQDTSSNPSTLPKSAHSIALSVIDEVTANSGSDIDLFSNFNSFRFLNDYRFCYPDLDKISVLKTLLDASPWSIPAARSGVSKKPQQRRFNSNYQLPTNKHKNNSFLTRAMPVVPLTAKLTDVIYPEVPQVLDSNFKNVKAVTVQPADGTVPLLRMKRDFAAKVPSKSEIKAKLQYHILGQDEAMEEMAMLGYQILLEKAHVEADATWKFRAPHKLVFGGTGTGKTYSVRKLAEILGISFIEINAPALVGEGYVGTPLSASYIPLKKAMGVEKFAIIFLDEMGKMCDTKWGDSVMKILLSHMNGINVGLPRENETLVNTSCFTYIGADACSAFNKPVSDITVADLTGPSFGMTQELYARFTGIIKLRPHTEDSLLRILKDAQDGAYNHARESFTRAFETETGFKVELEITDGGLLKIAKYAFNNSEGARVLEEVFGKIIHPLSADPNSFIEKFNTFKKSAKDSSGASDNKTTLGYRLEFSTDGATMKWIIDEQFIESNLPKMMPKTEENRVWQSIYM